jgi:hypothetical protein
VPHHGGLLLELADDVGEVICDLPDGLAREDLGMSLGLFDGLGVVRPARRQRRVAGVLEEPCPAIQLLGRSQRPWMKTTGVLPEALAFSICSASVGDVVLDIVVSWWRTAGSSGNVAASGLTASYLEAEMVVASPAATHLRFRVACWRLGGFGELHVRHGDRAHARA